MDECLRREQGHPWFTLTICSVKDTSASNRSYVIGIRRRGGAVGEDPLCTYDAVRAIWDRDYKRVRPDLNKGCPFFTQANGEVMNTTYLRGLARRFATFLGLDPLEFGGKSFRIGGATDWAEHFGENGRAILKQRGRWDSDCDAIYTRALLKPHLDGSAALGTNSGRDLERAVKGWIQPARR